MSDFFNQETVVLAHRGDSASFPENTLPAFESAVRMGVHVIETDVHLTSDREVVIWHDNTMERMTGDKRLINEMSWKEISQINGGYCFTRDGGKTYPYRENPIRPILLKELLSRFPQMRFNVDLKDNAPALAEGYAKILKDLSCINRVITASFHSKLLEYYRTLIPQGLTSCTSGEVLKLLFIYHTGTSFFHNPKRLGIIQIPEYSGRVKILTPRFIRFLHRNGYIVQVWTINDESEMYRFLQMGVDGIFTDRPALLMTCLKNLQKR